MTDQGRRQLLSAILAAGAVGAMTSYGSRTQAYQHRLDADCRVPSDDIDGTHHLLANEFAYTLFIRDLQNAFFIFRQVVADAELSGCRDINALHQLAEMENQGWHELFEPLPSSINQDERSNVSGALRSFSHNNVLQVVDVRIEEFLRHARALLYQDDTFLNNNDNPTVEIVEKPLNALVHAERIIVVQQLAVDLNVEPQGICDVFPIRKLCEWFGV